MTSDDNKENVAAQNLQKNTEDKKEKKQKQKIMGWWYNENNKMGGFRDEETPVLK